MSENCSHDCGSCGVEGCGERTPESLLEKPHEMSQMKKVIGVVSGKRRSWKIIRFCSFAVTAQRMGYRTAILWTADVTGPFQFPKMFGI